MELIKAYERFIPREMLRMLEREDITKVRLGNQVEKEMTVMFSDIRGFTSMSEECLSVNPLDTPAQIYLDRCDAFFQSGYHESTGEIGKSVEWTQDFEFGVPEIDEQHQELFAHANRLMEVLFEGVEMSEIKETVSFLDRFVASHFEDEEALMEEYCYPFSHYQKAQHDNFKDVFSGLKGEISLLDDSNRLYTLFRIQLLVVDWLVTHTAKQDRHLGRFIKRKQRGLPTL